MHTRLPPLHPTPQPERPSLEALLEDYWRLMPQYQGVALEDLAVLRILWGAFPTYRDSPLRPAFDRVLQVGDASGIQSPLRWGSQPGMVSTASWAAPPSRLLQSSPAGQASLRGVCCPLRWCERLLCQPHRPALLAPPLPHCSFGGFGALTRHLGRLTDAVSEALEAGMVDARSLALINGYNPGLSGAWMLQRAMSIPAGSASYRRDFTNRLLAANFKASRKQTCTACGTGAAGAALLWRRALL